MRKNENKVMRDMTLVARKSVGLDQPIKIYNIHFAMISLIT